MLAAFSVAAFWDAVRAFSVAGVAGGNKVGGVRWREKVEEKGGGKRWG